MYRKVVVNVILVYNYCVVKRVLKRVAKHVLLVCDEVRFVPAMERTVVYEQDLAGGLFV